MILGKKVRLEPNKSQTVLFRQFSGASRFAWNYSKALYETIWKTEGRYATIKELMKNLQDLKYNNPDYEWLNSIPEAITKQSMKDLLKAYKAAFTKRKQDSSKTKNKYLPKFKKKTKDNSFYQRTDKIHKVGDTHIKITGVKKPVKCKALRGIDLPEHILNPRVTFDGKYWYLSYSFEVNTPVTPHIPTIDKLGIDLGIKDLAILSNGVHYPNINKTRTVNILRKRLQRLQRQISRKYELNVVYKDGKKIYHKTSNIKKLERQLVLINRRITNIRNTYMYGVVNSLLKIKAGSIHLEDLNIRGMLQNPKIAKAIQEQNLHKFKQILTYKCKQNNIPLYLVDRWHPSSKLCSCCGWCNNNLKLTDRVFRCSNCGLVLDRDENASLNIANCPSGKLKRIA
jgi:transposase, IS605 orfB family